MWCEANGYKDSVASLYLAQVISAGKVLSEFQPQCENYQARVKTSFAEQALMQTLDISIVSIEPGKVVLQMPYQPPLTQQNGFLHAGIITTILDTACGYAAYSLMPEDASVLSVEFKTNLLRPAQGELFIATGKVIKPGRSITVTEGQLHAINDGRSKLVATLNGTMMAARDRPDLQ